VAPLYTTTSANIQCGTTSQIATDSSGNLWYIESQCYQPNRQNHHHARFRSGSYCNTSLTKKINVFNKGDYGSGVSPSKTITSNTGGALGWSAIAIGASGKFWVVSDEDYGGPLVIQRFNQSDSGSTTPLQSISGSNVPNGVYVAAADGNNGHLFISDQGANKIWVYDSDSTGNVAPQNHLSCSCFGSVDALAFDSQGYHYVADALHLKVYEFNGSDRGTVSPIQSFSMGYHPQALALCYPTGSATQCSP
jgi:hypothetical protein